MKIRSVYPVKIISMTAMAFAFILYSCNDSKQKEPVTRASEKTNTSDDESQASSIELQKKELNERSLACIALMNKYEIKQNEAYAAGDAAEGRLYKERMDSAARENARIGQILMSLEK